MKVYIGADHIGYEYKTQLSQALTLAGHEVIDVGNVAIDPNDDYTTFARELALKIIDDIGSKGILISGDGNGMAMAANRFKGIRAGLCWNRSTAVATREYEDSNVLCLASNYLSLEEAGTIMANWLGAFFGDDDASKRRIDQLDQLGN